jgi:uncharacterized membrane protein
VTVPVPRNGSLSGPAILFVGIAGALIHRLVPATSAWTIGIVVTQAALMMWLMAGQVALPHRTKLTVLTAAMITGAILWLGLPADTLGLTMAGVCHTVAYTGLLIWFGASLRPGREPVVTGFARRMRRTMPPDVVRYTRLATLAWCVFFAGQLALSLGLLFAAPDVWSGFVSVWNLPLVLAMVLAEFACRSVLFRRHQRTGLVATLAALRHMRGLPGSSS